VRALFSLLIIGLWTLMGCAPDIPDIEEHEGVTEDLCVDCHFYGDEGTTPPDRHWEGDGPKSSYEDCLDCHSFE